MRSAPLSLARHAASFGGILAFSIAALSSTALAAPSPPQPALTPRLLFGLALLGPMLVPAIAYAAGFIADLLQRNKDN